MLIVLVGVFSLILESTEGPHSHAVIIDAGSTGSRVHVFRFKMASGARVLKDEIFHAIKPGLKAHALDPMEAAKTLEPLMATGGETRARKIEIEHAADAESDGGAAVVAGRTGSRERTFRGVKNESWGVRVSHGR